MVKRFGLALALALLAGFAQADDLSLLTRRLDALASLEGSFQQTLLSSQGDTLEQSAGRFRLLRPGHFYWHIETPEEQLLIASNDVLWHYDIELETVTRRRLSSGNPGNPLTILGGDVASLEQHYRISILGDNGWRFEPRFESADFAAVELYFDADLPASLVIHDKLARQSVIRFSGLRSAGTLTPDDFLFTPPPGVDVYDSEP